MKTKLFENLLESVNEGGDILKTMKNKRAWYGISYPFAFLVTGNNCWFLRFWKKYMCPHGWHIFDECDSSMGHSLYCDACDLDIEIKAVHKWNYKTNTNDYLGE